MIDHFLGRTAGRLAQAAGTRLGAGHRIVWLLGSPRTGSTWLLALLGAHPMLDTVDEPLVGAHLGLLKSGVLPHLDVRSQDDGRVFDDDRSRPDYVLADVAAPDWQPPLRLLLHNRLLAHHWKTLSGGGYVVVKEPHGSEAVDVLFMLFPTSRLLFLVRDPRDVLDSLLDIFIHGWQGEGGFGALSDAERQRLVGNELALLRRRYQLVQGVYDRLPPDATLLVRYEDLLADTSGMLSDVVTWLGLRHGTAWAEQTAERLSFSRVVPKELTGPGRFHRAAKPGLWREHFTSAEQNWLNAELAEIVQRYGYEAT